MQKRTREIIALVLLIVLGIGAISAAAWYMLVGHNWNAAATSIDDRIGTMEGYTVILCEGSVPSVEEQRKASLSQPMLEQQNFGEAGDASDQGSAKPISLEAAIASYLEKDAQIVKVHCDNPGFYEDPLVVQRNGRRIGIFSVTGERPKVGMAIGVAALERAEADFKICLVEDVGTVLPWANDVDLFICLGYDEAGEEGRYIDSAYAVGSPYEGFVGAVIISPSGFLSSKMISIT